MPCPAWHEAIRVQTPHAYPSLWAVYKEMIPVLIKQATQDPDYHIERDLPTATVLNTASNGPSGYPVTDGPAQETMSAQWIDACAVTDIAENDVIGFNHNGNVYAIYRLQGNQFYASEGLCTHGKTELSGGLVINGCIECPKHNGRFEVTTGKAVQHPAKIDLKIHPAERRRNRVFVYIPDTGAEQ